MPNSQGIPGSQGTNAQRDRGVLDLQTETMKTDCFMGQKLGAGAGWSWIEASRSDSHPTAFPPFGIA